MNDWLSQLDTFRFASPWWLLALLLIPLGAPQALLPLILDDVLAPAVRLLTGG